jgi:proline racemase
VTIDLHTGGEPLRVIVEGLPAIEGETVVEKRRHFQRHYDHLRTGLMFEPCGHDRRDQSIDATGLGAVSFDIAYGGAFYAVVRRASVGGRAQESLYYAP